MSRKNKELVYETESQTLSRSHGTDNDTVQFHRQDLERWETSMKIYDQAETSCERRQIARVKIPTSDYLKRNILGWKVDVVIVSRK